MPWPSWTVKMPRITGLALKKLLEEKGPGMKFIFLTGHGSEEDFMIGSAEAGADYYLIKPVDLNLLIEKLKGDYRDVRGQSMTTSGK